MLLAVLQSLQEYLTKLFNRWSNCVLDFEAMVEQPLMMDHFLLKIYVQNAVSNGMKYGKKGGIITFVVKLHLGIVTILCRNEAGDGQDMLVGMTEQQVSTMFNKGTRLDLGNEADIHRDISSGDGAWLMQACARAMGGECSIRFTENYTDLTLVCSSNVSVTEEQAARFEIPKGTYLIVMDDSSLQRKAFARQIQMHFDIPADFLIVRGVSKEEIIGFESYLHDLINEYPTALFLLICDENLDYFDAESNTNRSLKVRLHKSSRSMHCLRPLCAPSMCTWSPLMLSLSLIMLVACVFTDHAVVAVTTCYVVTANSTWVSFWVCSYPANCLLYSQGSEIISRTCGQLGDLAQNLLAVVRSANDSKEDLERFLERTDGFLCKSKMKKIHIQAALAPLWFSKFGVRCSAKQQEATQAVAIEMCNDVAQELEEVVHNIKNNMADWKQNWSQLHHAKGALMLLQEHRHLAMGDTVTELTTLIDSLRGSNAPRTPDLHVVLDRLLTLAHGLK